MTTLIKKNFFAFTGGPGAGKTTLLHALHEMGFALVSETGRQIIKERLRMCLSPRPAPPAFARQMFEMDFDNFIRNADTMETVLFDRSFLDSASLLYECDRRYFGTVKDVLERHRFNRRVFITPPWKEIYKTDCERDQTFEESESVYRTMRDWYEKNNYTLVTLPRASVEERVRFVLKELQYGS